MQNTARPTQKQRLAAWARAGHGIRQIDWIANPPDGGGPILRVAAIVGFLEEDGFSFDRVRFGDRGMTEYRLLRDPAAVARALAAVPGPDLGDQGELFAEERAA